MGKTGIILAGCMLWVGISAAEVYYPEVRTKGVVSDGELVAFDGVSGRYIRSSGATNQSQYIESLQALFGAVSTNIIAASNALAGAISTEAGTRGTADTNLDQAIGAVQTNLNTASNALNLAITNLAATQGNTNAGFQAQHNAQAATNAIFEPRIVLGETAFSWGDWSGQGFISSSTNLFTQLTIGNRSSLTTNLCDLTQGTYTGVVTSVAYTGYCDLVQGNIYEWGFTKQNAYGTSTFYTANFSLSKTAAGSVSNYFTVAEGLATTQIILRLDGDGSSKSDASDVYVKKITGGSVYVADDGYIGGDLFANGTNVMSAIHDEVTRATLAEGAIQTNVNTASNALNLADGIIQTNLNTASNALSAAISTEAGTRGTADTNLDQAIGAVQTNLNTASNALYVAITTEVARATVAESALQSNITNEYSRATNMEYTLQANINLSSNHFQAHVDSDGVTNNTGDWAGTWQSNQPSYFRNWLNFTNTPIDVPGYGLTDVWTKIESDARFGTTASVAAVQADLDNHKTNINVHAIAAVSGLQTALDGKATTQNMVQVQSAQTSISNKVDLHTSQIGVISNDLDTAENAINLHTGQIGAISNAYQATDAGLSNSLWSLGSGISNTYNLATNALQIQVTTLKESTATLNTAVGNLNTATNNLNGRVSGVEANVVLLQGATNALNSNKLNLSGGTMTGAITNNIGYYGYGVGLTNVPVPATNSMVSDISGLKTSTNTLNTAVGNLQTATNAINTVANAALPKAGGIMTGPLTNNVGFYGNGIGLTNLSAPTATNSDALGNISAALWVAATGTLNIAVDNLQTATQTLNTAVGNLNIATNSLNTRAGNLEAATNALNANKLDKSWTNTASVTAIQITGGSPTTNKILITTNNLGETGWSIGAPVMDAFEAVLGSQNFPSGVDTTMKSNGEIRDLRNSWDGTNWVPPIGWCRMGFVIRFSPALVGRRMTLLWKNNLLKQYINDDNLTETYQLRDSIDFYNPENTNSYQLLLNQISGGGRTNSGGAQVTIIYGVYQGP